MDSRGDAVWHTSRAGKQHEAREVPGHKIQENTHSQGYTSAGWALKKCLLKLCVPGTSPASCFQGSLAIFDVTRLERSQKNRRNVPSNSITWWFRSSQFCTRQVTEGLQNDSSLSHHLNAASWEIPQQTNSAKSPLSWTQRNNERNDSCLKPLSFRVIC